MKNVSEFLNLLLYLQIILIFLLIINKGFTVINKKYSIKKFIFISFRGRRKKMFNSKLGII